MFLIYCRMIPQHKQLSYYDNHTPWHKKEGVGFPYIHFLPIHLGIDIVSVIDE